MKADKTELPLRDHEVALLAEIARLQSLVIARTIARDFTYRVDGRNEIEKDYSDEGCVLRALTRAHYKYLTASGYARPEAESEATKRALADLERILVVAQTMALDRLAKGVSK